MSMPSRRRFRRTPVILAVLGALVATGSTTLPAAAAPGDKAPKRSQLGKHDSELLAKAKAKGAKNVTLLIAAVEGQNAAVVSRLKDLGATIVKRDDEVSYLRVLVPTGKARQAADVAGIRAADLDEVIPLDDPKPQGTQDPSPQIPPGAATPRDNPYMPIRDTGAVAFTNAHPTWDGRNTTIGILDSGVDLDHPALKTTTTGERKITGWTTFTDPFNDNDPTWVPMPAANAVTGPTFTFGGVTYTAPNGSFRIGLFNERDPRLGGEVGSDVNRDGNPAGSSGIFAVLWNKAQGIVRVDANQNQNFTDEPAMHNYAKNFQVGHFGTDNPATPIREQMPFVVQIEKELDVVNIGIVSGQHGSHVAGITAANGMFGGAMSGAAPGAKIKSVRVCMFITGCTAHALVEGMIYIAKQKVDVINMSIGGLPALNDGNNARAEIYNQLIDTYKVQMFISAGNSGAGLNTVGDPSVATKVMSVGSYITKETWQKNYGSDSAFVDNLHGFSSRGPREDGGFKPQIIAPGSAVSTTPLWQPGGPVAGTYTLPPGYSMLNGTSMASPQSAGAGALLVSAAKASGVPATPNQLRQALNSSSRFLPRYGAHEQGNGLINVGDAWDLLKTNIKPVQQITSAVPVNTALSGLLATPGVGVGIYDREGVTTGTSYTRTYTFTRVTGGAGTRTYNLSWVGNDGTFSTATTLALAQNVPNTLDVTVNPTTAGVHSAILNLDLPGTVGIDYQTMNTVVAPEVFSAANSYTVTKSGTIGRNQVTSYFYRVPAGTPAFKVDMTGGGATPGAGQIRFLRFHPYGVGIDDNSSLSCYNPPVQSCATGSPTSRTTTNPQAGVWEVEVEARRTSDAVDAPYTLTASILGATVSPNPDIIPSASVGVPVDRSYTLTNAFGPFTGRAVGSTLGSALMATPSIANLAQQQRQVTVATGSTSLRATIGNTSDPAADLDLFVFNCTTGTCVQAGVSADGDSEESVTINNPAPGLWVTLVDGFAVPAGTTTYDYIDVFVNTTFGSVSVTDSSALRAAGAVWTVPGVVTANAVPAAVRVLLGTVQVRTDENVLVGSGDVIVQSVT